MRYLFAAGIVLCLSLFLLASHFHKAPSPQITAIPQNAPQESTPIPTHVQNPVTRVLVLDFNPQIPSHGRLRLRNIKGWSEPVTLEANFIREIKNLSGGKKNYQVVERLDQIDMILPKQDGFTYTPDEYFQAASNFVPHHVPDIIDYQKLITDFQICEKLNNDEIDEVWLWGGPWFGFYEAIMVGPTASFTNAPPITNTSCKSNITLMGFSYERGLSELLEDFGHRVEGVMAQKSGEDPRFQRIGITEWTNYVHQHGWMHQPPNVLYTAKQYIYDDPSAEPIPCSVWGCTSLGFKKWWLGNLKKEWWNYL